MAPSADALIEALGLEPHPEGGWFREVHRSSALSSIYYLLPAGGLAPLHRLRQRVEIWHHYAGAALTLHCIDADGGYRAHRLGPDLAAGEQPQLTVPAGFWQAARAGDEWALCGCTVAPPFDFADWEMPARAELLQALPQLAPLVLELTRA
jgi:predicted cupin superfamily sugar epimerase